MKEFGSSLSPNTVKGLPIICNFVSESAFSNHLANQQELSLYIWSVILHKGLPVAYADDPNHYKLDNHFPAAHFPLSSGKLRPS